MSNKIFVFTTAFFVAVSCFCLPGDAWALQRTRTPNVVVFYADDVGIGDITAYQGFGGTTTISNTPNVDELAAEGMLFTDAHSSSGLCAPSRYSLLTGNLPFRGTEFYGQFSAGGEFQVRPGQKTTGDIFSEAGYQTAFIGKAHMGGQYSDSSGRLYSPNNFRTRNNRRPGLSFVDWLQGFRTSVNDVGFDYSFVSHDGIQASPYIYFENNRPIDDLRFRRGAWRWRAATDNRAVVFDQDFVDNRLLGGAVEDVDSGGNNVIGWPYWNSERTGEVYTQAALGFIRRHQRNNAGQPFYMHFASQAVHIPHTPTTSSFYGEPVFGEEATPHLDMVREMDLQVKLIVDELKRKGLFDNTIFIFTSDNGGLRFSRQTGHRTSGIYDGRKGSPNEGGHRIPMIIRWANSQGGFVTPARSVCDEPVSQLDFFATFCDMLNLPQSPSQGLDSTSVLPYFFGDFSTPLRRDLINVSRRGYGYRNTRSGVKIIASYVEPTSADVQRLGPQANLAPPVAVDDVFNLSNDISEQNNLVNSVSSNLIDTMLFRLNRRIMQRGVHELGRSTRVQDRDGDGLFDYWERRSAGDLTTYDERIFRRSRDTDGDGVSDGDEYNRRSNPNVRD